MSAMARKPLHTEHLHRQDLVPEPTDRDVATITDWRRYDSLGFDPVLAAALRCFVETGYHGASVRSIARECDMSVSGIYHYYASKQSMLQAILDRGVSELDHRGHLALTDGSDPVQRFCRLIESLVLFHTYRREIAFVGASEMRSLEPEARRTIAARRTNYQRLLDGEVLQAVEEGQFHTSHPLEAARAAVTMCTSIAGWYKIGGELSPATLAAHHVEFALDLMRYEPT